MRNKKKAIVALSVLFLVISVFVVSSDCAWAQEVADAGSENSSWFGDIVDGMQTFFKWLLYTLVFVPITWIASGAIALFGFAANPDMLSGASGLLNRAVVYELWKFIRDFFNLFFIFSLLLVAFSTVFQIEKYSIKKLLLSIVLAALFVNFSFPIARFLIDAANVPMYFFAKQMMSSTGKSSSSDALAVSALSSTRIEQILLPARNADKSVDYDNTNASRLFLAIIFMFLFSVSLAVLAIMFVIRLTALVVLVIFSPIGFVAAAIPIDGLKKFSGQWWDYFNKYLIFGPVAMLMLLVTVRFMSAISEDSWYKQAENLANSTAGSGTDATAIAQQMILFSIPMIMIWMTIGISSKIGVAGAGAVEGWGKKVRGWGQKAAMGTMRAPFVNKYTKAALEGGKSRASNLKILGSSYKDRQNNAALRAEKVKGFFSGDGSEKAVDTFNTKRVNEAIEEHKKNKTSASSHEKDLKSNDLVTRKSAALSLAESKDIDTADRLAGSLAAVADNAEHFKKVVNAADKGSLDMSLEQYTASIAQRGAKGEILKDANGVVQIDEAKKKVLSGKMKKEGKISVLIEQEKAMNGGNAEAAYQEIVGGMNTKAIAGLDEKVLKDSAFQAYVASNIATSPGKFQKIMYNEDMSQNSFKQWKEMAPKSVSSDANSSVKDKADEYLRRQKARQG